MDVLQKEFDKIIVEAIAEAVEEAGERFDHAALNDFVVKTFKQVLDEASVVTLATIKQSVKDGSLTERRALHAGFVERNYARWDKGFDTLEILLEICTESGENNARRLGANELIHDNRFGALVRLHAKGCLVAREIFCLLLNGFADGAHARWRSLHELAVTALFLGKCDEETVEKYFMHEYVESYKGALMHNKYQERLQAKGLTDAELEKVKSLHDAVVAKYGEDFKGSYGWVCAFFNKKRANFMDIEECVGLDHLRPYYKWASQGIHATAKTLNSSLGMSEAKESGLLAGPSNSGLIDPAHSTAISLSQLTTALLSVAPNLDDLVSLEMIKVLTDDVGKAFIECGDAN